jgi:hypothetical protein
MRLSNQAVALLAGIICLVRRTISTPDVAFPVNSQVPPVAYTTRPYSFQFSATTFTSTTPPLSYEIGNAPDWLSIDSASRTLKGTPTKADVGAATFDLIARDASGTKSSSVTLVIASDTTITEGDSVTPALQSAGHVQEPSTLFLKPLSPFSIRFPESIFQGTSPATTHYAVSVNSSPLPSWVQFDAQTLLLTGTTPALALSSPQGQTYGVKLIASNVAGFEEAAVTFSIVIASRMLYFQKSVETVNVTKGQDFESSSLLDILYLDGNPLSATEIGSIDASLPSWLSINNTSLVLSGTAPQDLTSQTFGISVRDKSNDVAKISVTLQTQFVDTSATPVQLNLTVRQGEFLDYTLPSTILTGNDEASLDLGSSSNWLSFSKANSSLYGQVPRDLKTGPLDFTLSIARGEKKITYQLNLLVMSNTPSAQPSSSTSTLSTAGYTGDENTPDSTTKSSQDDTQVRPRHVVAIVVTSVCSVLAVTAIILCCVWWRRRRRRDNAAKEVSDDDRTGSAVLEEQHIVESDSVDLLGMGRNTRRTSSRRTTSGRQMSETPSKIPQIELPWPPDSLRRARSRLQKRHKSNYHESFDSNWGGLVQTRARTNHSSFLEEDMESNLPMPVEIPPPIPSYSPKRKQSAASSKIQKRKSSAISRDNRVSGVLLDVTNRQSVVPGRPSHTGIGHGAGILSPAAFRTTNPFRASQLADRSSWVTTYGTMLGKDKENNHLHASIISTDLNHFPVPPEAQGQRGDEIIVPGLVSPPPIKAPSDAQRRLEKPSLRLVTASPTNSITHSKDPETFTRLLKQFHTERARANLEGLSSHFSNASSRTPSISRFIPGTSAVRPSRSRTIAEEDDNPTTSPSPSALNLASSPPNWAKHTLSPLSAAAATPPLPSSHARSRAPQILSPAPHRPPTRFGLGVSGSHAQPSFRPQRTISVSSGQFSSALSSSSASGWEDYEIEGAASPSPSPLVARLYDTSASASGARRWEDRASVPSVAGLGGGAGGAVPPLVSPRLPFAGGVETEGDESEVGRAIVGALRRASAGSGLGSQGGGKGLQATEMRLVDGVRRMRVVSVDAGRSSVDTGEGSGGGSGGGGGVGVAWGGREKSQKGSLRFI